MKLKHVIYNLFLVFIVLIAACAKDSVAVNDGDLTLADCSDSISFSADVLPIIEQNCSTTGCHDFSASGGYDFSSYSGINQHSEIMKNAMKHKPGFVAMPLGLPKLNDSLIRKFECWILQGSLDN